MDVTFALFLLFSVVLLGASFRVITAQSTVHAALFLILAFFNASGIWMLLKAEFLAITLILVYVGAVMVLFLFVVMMLDVHTDKVRQGFWKHLPLAAVIGAVVAFEMAVVLMSGFQVSQPKPFPPEMLALGNTKMLGVALYTQYLYPLQVAAVLLLVGIIAAIALTLRERKDSRRQDPSQQVKVTKAERLRVLKIDPVKPVPAA
ncbi:MAG: NADH-quinone oxidoreductase subunit J, partial [Inhella sp.]